MKDFIDESRDERSNGNVVFCKMELARSSKTL